MLNNTSEAEEKLADKEEKALGANENTTPSTTSEGEYSEEVVSAVKQYYGSDDITRDSEGYTSKLEGMVASDLLPKAGKLKKYDEANTRLIAMMESEPELSAIMADMSKGATFKQAMARNIDIKSLSETMGSDDDWMENAKMREEKHAARMQKESEREANMEKSFATVEEFVAGKQMEGEDATKFGTLLTDFIERVHENEVTVNFLEALYYYMNREKELQTASETAALKAKNEKIALGKFDEKDYAGDGLPAMNAGASAIESPDETTPKDARVKQLDDYLTRESVIPAR